MADFTRPKEGFRFNFQGVNTGDEPDALVPEQFSAAQNIRTTKGYAIRTRPGYERLFTGGANITDIRSFSALGSDFQPVIVARDYTNNLWANGVNIGNLGNNNGFYGYSASLIPFRPAESAQAWMYASSAYSYQKYNASGFNAANVGTAEPQTAVDAAPKPFLFSGFGTGVWTMGGNGSGASSGNRTSDTIGSALLDNASTTRYYLQVSNNVAYAIGQMLTIGGNRVVTVLDVYPPVSQNLTVGAILYDSGSSGNCVIAINQNYMLSAGQYPASITGIRRGTLLKLGGSEVVYVQGVIPGPNGNLAIRTYSNSTWTAGAAIAGIPAIAVDGSVAISGGESIACQFNGGNFNNGTGTATTPLSPNPFGSFFTVPGNAVPQLDDYLHFSLYVSDPTLFSNGLLIFNLDGSNNYNTGNLAYYAIRSGDLVNVLGANQNAITTLLNAAEAQIVGILPTAGNYSSPGQSPQSPAQWSEILIPVSALNRLGSDQSKTLANATSMQFQFTVSNNNVVIQWSSFWVGGGGTPNTGSNAAPYKYRLVPMNSATGVHGCPSPVPFYGATPLRQPVLVKSSGVTAPSGADYWDIYRQGGTVTSYRYIGTVAVGSDYTDNTSDDGATGGSELVIDNTQPWPTIDVPYSANNNAVAYGNRVIITGANSLFPTNITRWLPGTVVKINNTDAVTLRARPTSYNNTGYLFQFDQSAGAGNLSGFFCLEPNIAAQPLPYLWGPDAYGTVFGCGDPLRPGVVSYTKRNNPDAAPSKNTWELCQPSEPLFGGEVIGGVSIAASSLRWWQLYAQETGYVPVEMAVGKRLAAPNAKCSDGRFIYFWAQDCIARMSLQGGAVSLTDDLYNLFPHAGMLGNNVVRGAVTYYAPDYTRARQFRIGVRDDILYALYPDSTGTFRMLVGLIQGEKVAWLSDVYDKQMSAICSLDQPLGPIAGNNNGVYPGVVLAATDGSVVQLKDYTGDGNNGISGYLYTAEYTANDLRVVELWGDYYFDVLAPYGMTVTPVSQGNNVYAPVAVAGNNNRQFLPMSLGNNGVYTNFMGLQCAWTDYPSNNNSRPTTLYGWQPSISPQVEITTTRGADWDNCGTPDNKYFQGIKLDADTYGANKNIVILDDSGNSHNLQPSIVNHNGRMIKAYSFAAPFTSHMVKDQPADSVQWRKFGIEYIFQPTPEWVQSWISQKTSHGLKGYHSIYRIEAAYASYNDVTLSISAYDGVAPSLIILPSTGGNFQKTLITPTVNKGMLYGYSATSNGNFQLYLKDWTIWVGQWGRAVECVPFRNLGGIAGDQATF